MTKSIVITVPHALGKDEARRRVAAEIEQAKTTYIDKFAQTEVTWSGDTAQLRVVALAQEITAHIDVMADSVRIEVFLPWILAAIASKLQDKISATTRETLAITHSSKKG